MKNQRLSHGYASTTADLKQKEQGSHAVGQEWTPEHLRREWNSGGGSLDDFFKIWSDRHNAALSAEREKREEIARTSLERVSKHRQQLLQAQAAIANTVIILSDFRSRQWVEDLLTQLKAVDLSALDRHDAELKAKWEKCL